MKILISLFLCFISPTLIYATAMSSYQVGINYPGNSYRYFIMKTPSARICEQTCLGEPYCKGWSYAKPGTKYPEAVCYLKKRIILAQNSYGYTSGRKYLSRRSTLENFVDRPGKTFYAFRTNGGAVTCLRACVNNGNCKAWTYIHAGYIASAGVCHLKSAKQRAFYKRNCCVSGIIY